MKRAGFLYDKICDMENLKLAFWKASKGKRDCGEVIAFRKRLEENLLKMRGQMLSHQPDLGHYHFFSIREPKERLICAASFPERILHHAVINICNPIFERFVIFDSYACREEKGNRRAIARCQEFARLHPWYLKLDIRQYFGSISHTVTASILSRLFKDAELLDLFDKILASYNSGVQEVGLPIGNLVSQHLANLYLGTMDHWLKEERRIGGYLRYMDDFVLFAADKNRLKIELRELETFLGDKLKLRLKDKIQLNRTSLGVPFLGFRIYPTKILLLPCSKRRFIRKMRAYMNHYHSRRWDERKLARHLEPLVDFTKIADSLNLRRKVIF